MSRLACSAHLSRPPPHAHSRPARREGFIEALHQPLPVTFRFTLNADAAFRAEGEALLASWARRGGASDVCWGGTRRLEVVDGWQLHVDKHALRAAAAGSEEAALREWLIRGSDGGKLVRQEVASMLPAALLGVADGDAVRPREHASRLGDPQPPSPPS